MHSWMTVDGWTEIVFPLCIDSYWLHNCSEYFFPPLETPTLTYACRTWRPYHDTMDSRGSIRRGNMVNPTIVNNKWRSRYSEATTHWYCYIICFDLYFIVQITIILDPYRLLSSKSFSKHQQGYHCIEQDTLAAEISCPRQQSEVRSIVIGHIKYLKR